MSKVFICHISNVLDYGTAYRSVAELIEDTCANLNSEKINSIWAKMANITITSNGETDKKIQDYAVNVCGWEISQDIPHIGYLGYDGNYANIWINQDNMAHIPHIQKVIQDIQENSKDWRCKYRIFLAKILKSTIFDLLNTSKESSQKSLDLKYI